MRDPLEVLRIKEQEIVRVRQEIEALRITAKLLGDESTSASESKIEFRTAVKMP